MHTEHKGHEGLYWFMLSESKTLRPVLDCIAVRRRLVFVLPSLPSLLGDALGRLILADGQSQWTGVQVGYNKETYL